MRWRRGWKFRGRSLHHADSLLSFVQLDGDPLTDRKMNE